MSNDATNPAQHPNVTQTTPFTPAEITDIRRFAGWGSFGGFGYLFQGQLANLDIQIANMSDQEQAVIRTVYLPNLTTLETAVVGAGTNMGTDQAAVWKRNRTEVADRQALFRLKRLEMCSFIGVEAGPGVRQRGGKVTRG
jgi:hypothetical protein